MSTPTPPTTPPPAKPEAKKPEIPGVVLGIVTDAFELYTRTGERRVFTKERLPGDVDARIGPDDEGKGAVLTVTIGAGAHAIASAHKSSNADAVRQAEVRIEGVERHKAILAEDFEGVKEDHEKGLRTDAELARSKAAYEDNLSHIEPAVEADRKLVAEKAKAHHVPKVEEIRVEIPGYTMADLLKVATVSH